MRGHDAGEILRAEASELGHQCVADGIDTIGKLHRVHHQQQDEVILDRLHGTHGRTLATEGNRHLPGGALVPNGRLEHLG